MAINDLKSFELIESQAGVETFLNRSILKFRYHNPRTRFQVKRYIGTDIGLRIPKRNFKDFMASIFQGRRQKSRIRTELDFHNWALRKKSGAIVDPTVMFYWYFFIIFYLVTVIFFDVEFLIPPLSVTVRVTE